MWSATWSGQAQRFHLAGINNQNFLMRDEATGSWWQQSTGLAIMGPLKGQALDAIPFDELTLAAFRAEHPDGRVLAPDPRAKAADAYAESDWEEHVAKLPVVTILDGDQPFDMREIVIGVTVHGESGDALRAYPMTALARDRVILDYLGGTPIAVVLGDDLRSVRAFERQFDGAGVELFLDPAATPMRLIAPATGGAWTFTGAPVSGDQGLARLPALPSYWFDWKQQHPETSAWIDPAQGTQSSSAPGWPAPNESSPERPSEQESAPVTR